MSGAQHHGALELEISLTRGDFEVEAELRVEPGEVLGLIGPNGAGKSSLLGATAGTHRLNSGRIRLAGRVLAEHSPALRTHLPRPDRNIGHLDQRPRLFPHLTIGENTAFGPRSRGQSRAAAVAIAAKWLERIGLADRSTARPHELSGGQQQRVALARALAATPEALLLDEPFAALDIDRAAEIRAFVAAEISRVGVPTVLVTHNPIDLLTLATRVAVIEDGRIRQVGSVSEVLADPATNFAASFAGRVLITGVATRPDTIKLTGAPMPRITGVTGAGLEPGQPARATYDPFTLRVTPLAAGTSLAQSAGPSNTAGSTRMRWIDRIAHLAPSHAGLTIGGEKWPTFTAEVPLARAVEAHLRVGELAEFTLDSKDIRLARMTAAGALIPDC